MPRFEVDSERARSLVASLVDVARRVVIDAQHRDQTVRSSVCLKYIHTIQRFLGGAVSFLKGGTFMSVSKRAHPSNKPHSIQISIVIHSTMFTPEMRDPVPLILWTLSPMPPADLEMRAHCLRVS